MELSAGIIFVKDGAVLMGHATETPHWDIPKGHVEKGETHIDAALCMGQHKEKIRCLRNMICIQ